ncbi:hypothetical protein GCM10009712_18350 [Pseudarthrobacter sulfonivorans]|uniref:hypothetical protein n=1 Tax=Pseudarthrobacter sulfonivorans TaxID=121292 RepID=UPI00168AAD3A|nr:hypothetical protein [Pseudarthrobacter sulfonivorans]
MTELNDGHNGEPAQPTPEWPESATERITDPAVEAIVAVLDGVRHLPVAEHEAVYSELHDALLLALNEDAPNGEGKA